MRPAQVLERASLVLGRRERERYFEDGFLVVPAHVDAAWLARPRAVVAAKIEESRALTASDDQFDLAPDHSAEKPNIRRLRKAIDQHPDLWAFAQDPVVLEERGQCWGSTRGRGSRRHGARAPYPYFRITVGRSR